MKTLLIDDLKSFEELDEAIEQADRQTLSCLPEFEKKYKRDNSINNFYIPSDNDTWTTGMWTGELNLMYEMTGNEYYKEIVLNQIPDFLERINTKRGIDNHDQGFIFSPSCVAAWKLYKNEKAKEAAIKSADYLLTRFNSKGKFFQAWGEIGDKAECRLIIDCLMNLPLLFWASSETKDLKYKQRAIDHLQTAIKYVLKEDNSTYHTYYFDIKTGHPLEGVTCQGYSNETVWSRGQAWGIYGAALAYKYLGTSYCFNVFEKTLDYFLKHLPSDFIPYWDFSFTNGSDEPRDSSSLAIAICGMLEMARNVSNDEYSNCLKEKASKLLRQLWVKCAVKNPTISNGQLLHGTYARKSPFNPCRDNGVDECTTWGDYFYIEALMRLKNPNWVLYW